jgi:hypothetical protein
VLSWGKPLTKVFGQWPIYDATNTIIMDHKGFQVGCNFPGNVIITTPFYVHRLGKLGEDGNYLKASLWPVLEGFKISSDVLSFRELFPSSFLGPEDKKRKLIDGLAEFEVANDASGEGTSEPQGST